MTPRQKRASAHTLPELAVSATRDSSTGHYVCAVTTEGSFPLALAGASVWTTSGPEQINCPIHLTQRTKSRGRLVLSGSGEDPSGKDFHLALTINQQKPSEPWVTIDAVLRNASRKPIECSAELLFVVPANEIPRWLVPGMFYKDNGYNKTARVYPRFHPHEHDPEKFVSPFWSFRADRCASPIVFARVNDFSYFVSTDEQFSHGTSSVGFGYESLEEEQAAAALALHFPWREVPVQYAPHNPNHLEGEVGYVELDAGDEMKFSVRVGVTPDKANYGFSPVLRALYARHSSTETTAPWMSTTQGAELAAHGLFNWFYDPEFQVMYETCGFDKYFAMSRGLPGYVDRPHMHVSWVSGIAYAYAMARFGDENDRPEYLEAGNAVIDHICRDGIAPCGAFWGQWTREDGWNGGWNPEPTWLHARTLGEACNFLARALDYETSRGRKHPSWKKALTKCLGFALRLQRQEGSFGTYYDAESGEVKEWTGSGGLAWIPALTRAAATLGKRSYLKAAIKAGKFYRSYLDDAYFYGGCEDVSLSPCSEDGYNALMAYAALYEATGDSDFLKDSQRAAEWMLTFRWMYNTVFSPTTLLGEYNFHTRGGDVASPPNQHLHNYGLIAHEALCKLWMWTGDQYYYDRARDHLHYALQMIAREDGDMGARRGMMSEQWYHTDWWQPKGCMLQLAHIWCAGFLILVDQAQREMLAAAPRKFVAPLKAMLPPPASW